MTIQSKFSLENQVGIVTGGGSGLGKGYVKAMAEAGAHVMIADIDLDHAEATAEANRSSGLACSAIQVDVCSKESVNSMVERTLEIDGRLDFIVNNAGGWRFGPAEEVTEDSWRKMIDLNLNGLFFCCQAASLPMLERKQGCILNIASISGTLINPAFSNNWLESSYFAAKAGVIHLTRALAAQWGPKGIRTNAISPGYMTKTGLDDEAMKSPAIPLIPLGRPGLPEELGSTAVFLAAESGAYINGHNLIVDGGCSVM